MKKEVYYNSAQYILFEIYYNGKFIQRNINKGIFYSSFSSDNGIINGDFFLGFLHHKRKYINRNITQANNLYKNIINVFPVCKK